MSLRKRFESFVTTLDGFESIDALLRNRDMPGKKRADYLVERRKFIIEQKELEVDQIEKSREFLSKLMEQGQFLLLGGQVSADYIFSKLPDGQRLKRELVFRVTRALEGAVSHADKQTRDTRDIFAIPDAPGILIILNEMAPLLTPDVIRYALAHLFQKTTPDGRLQYSQNDGILLISEAHTLGTPGYLKAFPILPFTAPQCRAQEVVLGFFSKLMEAWAKFNGASLVPA
jgi:hypothetical protein